MKRKRFLFFVNIFFLLGLCFFLVEKSAEGRSIFESYKITRSIGYPWEGRLENGVPFPRQFSGYILRSPDHTYTTPELIGALLDALNGVREKYPNSCDLYIGDFSKPGGGPWYPIHRSHQNGRDVDLGMYARDNRCLSSFIPMDGSNLDVEKTWCLIEKLLATGMVENIFVDRSIQELLFKYARTKGYSDAYLDRLFGNCGNYRGSAVISHEPGHKDHLHVRFFAPWSELAGRFEEIPEQEKRIIALAQQSFLPQRVLFYVQHPADLRTLSQELGVSVRDLQRWNNLGSLDVLHPGMSLVFYKRHFEMDAVKLALSLDAKLMRSNILTKLAMLQDQVVINVPSKGVNVSDRPLLRIGVPTGGALKKPSEKPSKEPSEKPLNYIVKKGDTLLSIAKRYGVSLSVLCVANKIPPAKAPKVSLKPGQSLLIPRKAETSRKKNLKVHIAKPGDTLWNVARMYTVSVEDLMRANKMKANSVIKPGMRIIIPD